MAKNKVIKQAIPVLCDFNYDADLINLGRTQGDKMFEQKYIEQCSSSWYYKALDEFFPVFDQIKAAYPNLRLKHEEIYTTFESIFDAFYKDKETFKKEYMTLLPTNPGTEHLIFGHNDTQENNFLSNGHEVKVIDYDYSSMNYRGCDLAAYIIEASLNYDPTLPHFYRYEQERFGNFN